MGTFLRLSVQLDMLGLDLRPCCFWVMGKVMRGSCFPCSVSAATRGAVWVPSVQSQPMETRVTDTIRSNYQTNHLTLSTTTSQWWGFKPFSVTKFSVASACCTSSAKGWRDGTYQRGRMFLSSSADSGYRSATAVSTITLCWQKLFPPSLKSAHKVRQRLPLTNQLLSPLVHFSVLAESFIIPSQRHQINIHYGMSEWQQCEVVGIVFTWLIVLIGRHRI